LKIEGETEPFERVFISFDGEIDNPVRFAGTPSPSAAQWPRQLSIDIPIENVVPPPERYLGSTVGTGGGKLRVGAPNMIYCIINSLERASESDMDARPTALCNLCMDRY
jgi:hypothetical protein